MARPVAIINADRHHHQDIDTINCKTNPPAVSLNGPVFAKIGNSPYVQRHGNDPCPRNCAQVCPEPSEASDEKAFNFRNSQNGSSSTSRNGPTRSSTAAASCPQTIRHFFSSTPAWCSLRTSFWAWKSGVITEPPPPRSACVVSGKHKRSRKRRPQPPPPHIL